MMIPMMLELRTTMVMMITKQPEMNCEEGEKIIAINLLRFALGIN
jgi:hypothetical protein